jgi:phenylacetate-coenzyme A ligase PaaK-like adenylate-forming protein
MSATDGRGDRSGSGSPEDAVGLIDYRLSRLRETLSFLAENSRYYGKLLEQPAATGADPDSVLRSLPPMSPAEWGANCVSMRTGPVSGATIGYTGGTTSRIATPVLSVQRELRMLEDLTRETAAQNGLALALINPNVHGPAAMAGFGENVIVHALESPEHYEQVTHILERRIEPFASMRRIDMIESTGFRVKALSLYLMRNRGRMDDLGISQIFVGRNILSPRWRSRLETWWEATITPVYGFSEMRICNAYECTHCGYHHVPVTGLAEVLSDESGRSRVSPGERGFLAVTGFYPFIQLEPRIRYMPGDIAQLAPSACPHWGEHGFRPLGRRTDSVRSSDDGAWICPADVHALLGDHPDVNRRSPRSRWPEGLLFDESFPPRFRLEPGDPVKLHIELRFLPDVWPAKWSALRDSIRHQTPDGLEIIAHEPGDFDDNARC